MSAADKARTQRRAEERAERDRNRRIRRLAVVSVNNMAERDETISGMTYISPDGELEYIPVMRAGRA
jgi:hypothetical protein